MHRWTLVVLTLALAGCNARTAGEAITLSTGVRGASGAGSPAAAFTNARGWEVRLTTARVAVGPLYFYSEPPLQARRWTDLLWSSASACPTHAQQDKGDVLAEVLQQYVVDLVSGATVDTGLSSGLAGTCRMFEVHLHPPGEVSAGSPASEFDALGGATVLVQGTASREGVTRPFQGALTIPDLNTMRIVENVPADQEFAAPSRQPGRAVVEIRVDRWFENVDFAPLTRTDAEGRFEIDPDSQAHAALLSGVRSRSSYTLQWSAP